MGDVDESSSRSSLAGGSDVCVAAGGSSSVAGGGRERKLSGLRSSGTPEECSRGAGASSVCTLAVCVCSALAAGEALFFLEYASRRRVDLRVT